MVTKATSTTAIKARAKRKAETETEAKTKPQTNAAVFRVCYVTSLANAEVAPGQAIIELEKTNGSIGRYVRALAIYEGLERAIRSGQLDLDKLPSANATIEFSVVGFANGNLAQGLGKLLAAREALQEQTGQADMLYPGEITDLYSPAILFGEQPPNRVLKDYFDSMHPSQRPDLLLVDGVSTLWAMRSLLWQRSGKCLSPETLPLHLAGIDVMAIASLANTKIWLLVRFEPNGLPTEARWTGAVDRLYFLENFTQPHGMRTGWLIAKERRNPANMTQPGEWFDRKLIASVTIEPTSLPASNSDSKHNRARLAKKRLFEALKKPEPETLNESQTVQLVAVSGGTDQAVIADAKTELITKAGRAAHILHATPETLPGGLAPYLDGLAGLVSGAGYNSFHEFRRAHNDYKLGRHLQAGHNLHFRAVEGSSDQLFRERNATKMLGDTTGKYLEPGNGVDYLAGQIFNQAVNKLSSGDKAKQEQKQGKGQTNGKN